MKSRSFALFSAFSLVLTLLVAFPAAPVVGQTLPGTAAVGTVAELRTAIADTSVDRIEIAPGVYELVDASLVIERDLTLVGVGSFAAEVLIVGPTARGGDRVIDIQSGTVGIERLQVTGGDTGENGGGIRVQAAASLTLKDVEVVGNSADEGGGIYNAGTTTITHSLIYQNSARRKGGGIENDGFLTVWNTTITDNIGKGGGGLSTAGTADLAFVTVFSNFSTNKIGAGTLRNGGNLVVENSIIANNVGSDGDFHDCSGTPNLDKVIVTSDQGCNPEGTYDVYGPTEVVELLPPADNGGPTLTLALVETSPAIDYPGVICVDPNGDPVTDDQRGVARDANCDLGAYEYVPDQTPPVITLTPDPAANPAGWNNSPVTVTVAATDAETGVVSVTYSAIGVDPIAETTVPGPMASFVVDAEGTTTVLASALDEAGNVGYADDLEVNIDLTPPTVAFSAVPDSGTGDVAVTLTPDDGLSGVADFTYQVGSGDVVVPADPTLPVEVVIAASGDTTITYSATDAAGNTFGDSQTVTIAALTFDLALSTSAGSVEVGAVSAPLDSIVAGVAQASETGSPVESTPFSAIPFSAITIEDAPFSAISLEDVPFSAIPFSAIPFSAIPFSAIPFSAIPFSAIPFSAIPFSAIDLSGTPFSAIGLDAVLLSELSTPDGGSIDAYLAGTPLEGTPLQALNLGDLMSVPFSAIEIADSPFSAIPFSAIPFSAIDLSGTPFSAIPFSAIGDVIDCSKVDCVNGTLADAVNTPGALLADGTGNSKLTIGDVLGFDDVNLTSTVLAALPFSAIALGSVSLEGIPFSAIGPAGTQLDGLAAWCEELGTLVCDSFGIDPSAGDDNGVSLITLALSGVDLNAVPFSAIGLQDLPFSAIPLGVIPFSAINWQTTPVGTVPFSAIDFNATPFSAIGDVVDCSIVDCVNGTLVDAYVNGAFLPSFLDTASLAFLDAFDLGDYSLADLLFGLLPAEDLPWIEVEDLNAIRLPAADGTQPTFDYSIDFTVGNRDADVDVTLTLPVGFVPAGDATLDDGGTVAWTEALPGTGANPPIVVEFETLALSPGDYTISLPVWAGVVLGDFTATADGSATRSTGSDTASDTASITVIEAGEIGSTSFPSLIDSSGDCLQGSNLEISHISAIDDVDVYSFQVPDGCNGARIEVLMTNLGADLDLALLGPPASAQYLRGEPRSGYGYIEDHTYDLNPDDDALDADVLRDIPVDADKLGLPTDVVPVAVSANRGTADEQLEARTPRTGRDYYLITSGYNGATTSLPFGLQAQLSGSAAPACAVSPIGWSATTTRTLPGIGGLPADLNTLFLYNAGWLEGSSDPAASDVLAALAGVGSQQWVDLGVIGAALPVDADSAVVTALGTWYSNTNDARCNPEAANDIVRAIGSLIDDYTSARPSITNIVIVGDDAQIPFARLVDNVTYSNETDHAPTIPAAGELQSALAGGYYYSDDPYGSSSGIKIADGEFFVPDRAVGRLVETPAQILGQFNDFLGYSGVLDPSTGGGTLAAAAGYDFLRDGVDEIVANMTADGFDFTPGVLNEQGGTLWSAAELIALLDTPNLTVASINAHFDQYRSLPSLGNATGDESDLFVVGNTTINRALLFSMGCHGGLNVSNVQIGANPVWAGDWAESFAGLGDLWVANSGYGYGDSAMVAYSEAVSAAFADFIGTNTVGQAWMLAKQDFASGLFVVSPYHVKSMNEWILYGFPMFRTSADIPVQPELPPLGSGPGLIPDPFGSGLDIAPAALASTNLELQTTPAGNFYFGNAGTLEVRGRAVTALSEIDVTIPDGTGGLERVAGGAIVTGLTSEEENPFTPLIFNPIVDLGDGESPGDSISDRFPVPEAVFPAGLSQVVDHVDEDGQLRQKLLLASTRFDPQGDGSTGSLEKFTSFEATVYYRPAGATDTTPPLIRTADGVSDGEIAYFSVDVDGDAGSPDDVLRVNVLFGPANPGGSVNWLSIDLVRVGSSTTWVGGAPVDDLWPNTREYAFWVQTCDTSANCGSSTAKGVYFATTDTGGGDVVSIQVLDAGTSNQAQKTNGWYGGAVDAVATTNAGLDIDRYVLDGVETDVPDQASLTVPISADGGHFLLIYDTAGNIGAQLLAIDSLAPAVVINAPAGSYEFGDSVEADYFCTDLLSGISACDGDVPDGGTVQMTAVGDFTFMVTATDRAGNQTVATSDYSVVDTIAPEIVITTPAPDGSTVVEIGSTTTLASFACTDAADANPACTAEVDGQPVANGAPLPADAPGTYTLTVTATDASGNQATASATYSVGYGVCLLYNANKPQPATGAVAIKLQLCDADGNNLSDPAIELTAEEIITQFNGMVLYPGPNDTGSANEDFLFRYDDKLEGYIYNLNTTEVTDTSGAIVPLGPGDYLFRFSASTTGDVLYDAPFKLK